MLSLVEEMTEMERRRGIMGSDSQAGRGEDRSVLLGVSAEGWVWRRLWDRCFQYGRGTVLIYEAVSKSGGSWGGFRYPV